MAKSTLGVIMALFITTFSFANASASASDPCLPLVDKGSIPTPAVLADRMDESLKKDPSGKGPIRGASITPLEYLEAINTVPRYMGGESGKYSPTVQTVGELPEYLRHLVKGEMPKRKVNLAGVCEGKLTLGTHEGSGRMAHPDEMGWRDEKGDLILAGDCLNTPIPLQIVVDRGLPMKSMLEAVVWTDPYAGKDREVRTISCPLGEHGRYVAVHMLEPKAAEDMCSQEHMLPADGRIEGTGARSDWSSPDAFSRFCGQKLHEAKYQFGTTSHAIKLSVVDGDKREDFFSGMLKGKTVTAEGESEKLISKDGEAVFIPTHLRSGTVVAFFSDQAKVRTPAPSGVGEDLSTFKDGCAVKILTGIDMP